MDPQKKDQTQAEGSRDETRGGASDMGSQDRGRKSHGSSGISNRGMSGDEEQSDLPSRGSSSNDSSDQSER